MSTDYRSFANAYVKAMQSKKEKEEKKQVEEYDQPWYLDALDYISRPQRAVTGAIANWTDGDASTTGWQGLKGGISGTEKKDFDDILNNLGWNQAQEGGNYNWLKGRKGNSWYAPDLFDITSFLGNVVFDPLTYTGVGGLVKSGVGGVVRGVAKNVAEDATEKIAGKAVKLGKSVTVKGQNKAIDKLLDDIAQKTVDDTAKLDVIDEFGDVLKTQDDVVDNLNRLQREKSAFVKGELQAGKAFDEIDASYYDNLISENTQALRDFKAATTPLNRDLVQRTYGKQIDDAVKGSRVEGQNSLLNWNIPFTKFEGSIFKKPEWSGLVYRDLPIGAKEATAATEMLQQAFTSVEEANKIKQLSEAKPTGYKNEIKKITEEISKRKDDFLQKSYGKSESQLTTQEFQDLLQRTSNIQTRSLPDSKVLESMNDAVTGKPTFDVAKQLDGYSSKFLRDFSVKGIPKETRKMLDELDHYLNIVETNKGMLPKGLDKNFLEFVSKNVTGSGKNKGKAINSVVQKRIDDLKNSVDFNQYTRYVTPTSKATTIGADTSKFVADAGGTSALRSKLSRNIFNARTLRSQEQNVNNMGDEIVDANNKVVGRRREMERMMVTVKQQAKGLSDKEIRDIIYVVQKDFPDELLDSPIAQKVLDLRVNLKQIKEQYNRIKNSKSQVNVQKAAQMKQQIEDLTNEISKIKGSNKLSFKESILRIANGADGSLTNEEIKRIAEYVSDKSPNKLSVDEFVDDFAQGYTLIETELRNVLKKAEQIEGVAQNMSRVAKEIKRADEASGNAYASRANYFPHVVNRTDQELDELEAAYRDDPEIGALITKSKSNQFAKERKSYQTMAQVDNALAVLQEQQTKFPANSKEFDELQNKIDVVSNLYERDPFTALTKRYYKSIKSNAMRDLQGTLTKNGYIIAKGKDVPKYTATSKRDYYKELNKDEARALGLAEGTMVHREVLDGLERVKDVFTDKGIEKVLRNVEAANNVFKTLTTTVVPSHYWYNFVGLVTNNTMAGVGASSYREAYDLLNARKSGKLTKQQEKIISDMLDKGVLNQTSYSDMLESSFAKADNRADDSGIFTRALRGAENLAQGNKDTIKKIQDARFVPKGATLPLQAYGGYVRAGRATSDVMDNFFRTAHYLDVLAKTKNTKMAADSVRKHLFNYQELTSADRAVRAFVPFWNWTKNNIPLQVEKALKSPKYMATYEKLKDQSTQDLQDDSAIPGYLKGEFLKLGDELYNPRLPIQDLAVLTDPRKAASMTSPFVRSPFELLANHQLYTGKPIDYNKYYGNADSYFDNPEYLARYLTGQTGVGSRFLSGYEGMTNEKDSKNLFDNIQDLLMGRSRNIEDVKNKTEYPTQKKQSSSKSSKNPFKKFE